MVSPVYYKLKNLDPDSIKNFEALIYTFLAISIKDNIISLLAALHCKCTANIFYFDVLILIRIININNETFYAV